MERVRHSPATIVAGLALVIAAAGSAFAASPAARPAKHHAHDNSGLTRAQRAQVLALINQQAPKFRAKQGPPGPQGPAGAAGRRGATGPAGAPGQPGKNGATNVVVRWGTPTSVLASTTLTITASCAAGERATGGGVQPPSGTSNDLVREIYSTAMSGNHTASDGAVPDGWATRVVNTDTTKAVTEIATVVCAAQ